MTSAHPISDFARRLRELMAALGPVPVTKAQESGTFNSLALELFALQFELNHDYRRLCQARGASPGTITRWDGIPAVSTSAFKELDLSCIAREQRKTFFESSGTTRQTRSRHWHHADSLQLYTESSLRWFVHCATAAPTPATLAFLTPGPAAAPNSSLVYMFDVIRRNYGADESVFLGGTSGDAWTLEAASVQGALEAAASLRTPTFVFGTAFSFVQLLDDLATRSVCLALAPGSRVLETGGYKGRSRTLPKPQLHALISRHLGVPRSHILSEYGMSELSSQAYDTLNGPQLAAERRFRFPPWARALIISPETGREAGEGQTGLLQVFDLANVYSVMAIQTEDLAVRREDSFELLGRAQSAESRGCSLMTVAS